MLIVVKRDVNIEIKNQESGAKTSSLLELLHFRLPNSQFLVLNSNFCNNNEQ